MREYPEFLPGAFTLLTLRILRDGPLHCLAIVTRIKECSSGVLDIEEPVLDPALQRMVAQGLLETDWGEAQTNLRTRFYRLSPRGRERLRTEAREFRRTAMAISEVLETA